MKFSQFRVLVDAWKEPDRLERMRYAISYLVYQDEICLAEINSIIVVASSSEGKYVIPVWPGCGAMEATFARDRPEVVARLFSRKEFETKILRNMEDDELIAVFPNQELQYEQLDRNEMAKAIEYVDILKRGREDTLTAKDSKLIERFFPLAKK